MFNTLKKWKFIFTITLALQINCLLLFSQQQNSELEIPLQNYRFPLVIKGNISDKVSKADIPYASIHLYEKDSMIKSGNSDSLGNFKLLLNENEVIDTIFDLIITHVGFVPTTISQMSFQKHSTHKIFFIEMIRDTLKGHLPIENYALPPIKSKK